jgi:hypothetical protein
MNRWIHRYLSFLLFHTARWKFPWVRLPYLGISTWCVFFVIVTLTGYSFALANCLTHFSYFQVRWIILTVIYLRWSQIIQTRVSEDFIKFRCFYHTLTELYLLLYKAWSWLYLIDSLLISDPLSSKFLNLSLFMMILWSYRLNDLTGLLLTTNPRLYYTDLAFLFCDMPIFNNTNLLLFMRPGSWMHIQAPSEGCSGLCEFD